MSNTKSIRTTVSLAPKIARRVRELAKTERISSNRVLVDLIDKGLQARDREKERFFELAQRLIDSKDPSEQQILKKELARMTFGS